MARKTAVVEIPRAEGNRDSGKVFLLTEMSASALEEWAWRFLLVASREQVIEPEIMVLGMLGVLVIGLRGLTSGVGWLDAKPLLDTMWACIQIIPDPKNHNFARSPMEEDIEELSTRLFLRDQVFKLHTGFTLAAATSKIMEEARARAAALSSGLSAPTSPAPST